MGRRSPLRRPIAIRVGLLWWWLLLLNRPIRRHWPSLRSRARRLPWWETISSIRHLTGSHRRCTRRIATIASCATTHSRRAIWSRLRGREVRHRLTSSRTRSLGAEYVREGRISTCALRGREAAWLSLLLLILRHPTLPRAERRTLCLPDSSAPLRLLDIGRYWQADCRPLGGARE